MEVYLTGISEFLSAENLHKRLEPTMKALRIDGTDYETDKPRKFKWAKITFRSTAHAQAFLEKHGEQLVPRQIKPPPSSRTGTSANASVNGSVKSFNSDPPRTFRKARLQLMGQDVFCRPSNGPPKQITLGALQYNADEKVNPTRKIEIEKPPDVFSLRSLSCGLTGFFDEGYLTFTPEVEYRNITGYAKFSKRWLHVKWQQLGPLATHQIMRANLDTVVSMVYTAPSFLNITLSEEPSFFEEQPDLAGAFASMGLNAWPRPNEPTRTRTCHLDQHHAKVVGHCLSYQLEVSDPDLRRKIAALKNHPVVSFVSYHLPTIRLAPGPSHLDSSMNAMRKLMNALNHYYQKNELAFGYLYQLQALAWNAYLPPHTVLELAENLKNIFRLDKLAGNLTNSISVEAMKRLFKTISWPQPNGDPSEFQAKTLVQRLKAKESEIRKDSAMRRGLSSPNGNLAHIFRITVTPTRITLHGPELEAKNRILRKFENDHQYFARVQFCDENGQDLFYNGRINLELIYAKYKQVLNSGIQIAGRVYGFLGFSHSSLRSHSAWFMAPFTDQNGNFQTYGPLIKALGDFGDFRCPARCAARIGQAFSETPTAIDLDYYGATVKLIPDVKTGDGSRVFSDGVGTLSRDLVDHIWAEIAQSKGAPTAFQVRYKGAKGMLAIDCRLKGSVMCLRKSMVKFTTRDRGNNLEICDMASKPIPLVLNRQMVKILEDMGVDNSWFLDMQEIRLSQLRAVTDSTYNVAQFLKQQNIGEGIRFHRFLRQLENMGLDYRQDPFLCSIVEASFLRELRLLKHKARIPIFEGITLFGIMDETGDLKEGEVYVALDTMNGRFAPAPENGRRLIVTRSPALHPGDIQLAIQRVPPEQHPLREHYNVIVFSQHGTRDLPSQLSGGDLDGDIYNVIWDEEAMPRQVFTPADYPRVEPTDLQRPVEKEDMTQFFIDFMKLDHLGVIATRHMILADQRDKGTLDNDCLKLAELHSKAVDFSKNGHHVDLIELPRAEKYRPDFFAPGPDAHIVDRSVIELDKFISEPAPDDEEDGFRNPRHGYYKSNKILGILYRAINEQEIWNDQVKAKVPPLNGMSFWDQFLAIVKQRYQAVVPRSESTAWVSRMITARELRDIFETAVVESMFQHSEHPVKPLTEIEVFIGNILNRTGVQTSRQRDNSIKLKDSFDRTAQWITKSMRMVRHGNDAVPLTGYQTKWDNLHLCLACVYVGGEEESGSQGRYYENLQSFRVVAACALLSELNLFDGGGGGGGYVGVRG